MHPLIELDIIMIDEFVDVEGAVKMLALPFDTDIALIVLDVTVIVILPEIPELT